METIVNHENRNTLVRKVISGEIPAEIATIGLARVEVKIFYRKLDRAFQAMQSYQLDRNPNAPVLNHVFKPIQSDIFPVESCGPFRIFTTFKDLVA